MRIIKLNATNSTNTFLKSLSGVEKLEDYTVVMTKHQTNGKGQMGKLWHAKNGENLTFSVFKQFKALSLKYRFYISIVCALALYDTLLSFKIPRLYVKWPNDILSANKKIAGVLIENVIQKKKISHTIIGIGLNVNQTVFEGLPNATSMQLLTGVDYSLDAVLNIFIKYLKYYFSKLDANDFESLMASYVAKLYRKNKPSTFKDENGIMFSGFIKGVEETGSLIVLLEDNIIKEYAFNEVSLLY